MILQNNKWIFVVIVNKTGAPRLHLIKQENGLVVRRKIHHPRPTNIQFIKTHYYGG